MQEKLPLTFAECKTKLETGEDIFFIYPVHYQNKIVREMWDWKDMWNWGWTVFSGKRLFAMVINSTKQNKRY